MRRLTLVLILALPLLALAQEPAPAPPDEAITPAGYLLRGVVSLAGLALTAFFAAGATAIAKRSKGTAAAELFDRLFGAAKTAAAHADAALRPQLMEAFRDGKLSTEEAEALKKKATETFNEIAGELLEKAPELLGVPRAAIPVYVSGLIERAVKSLKTPAPSTTNVVNKVVPRE